MNNILDIINYYIELFYNWLFSYPTWKRNILFLGILLLPAICFLSLSNEMMPPAMAVLYVIYLLALIVGFVQHEEEHDQ